MPCERLLVEHGIEDLFPVCREDSLAELRIGGHTFQHFSNRQNRPQWPVFSAIIRDPRLHSSPAAVKLADPSVDYYFFPPLSLPDFGRFFEQTTGEEAVQTSPHFVAETDFVEQYPAVRSHALAEKPLGRPGGIV